MTTYYIGLSTTFHDPALAIVAPDGEVLFAEAAERYLQYKRAFSCEPDNVRRMETLVKQHIPPTAQVVIATTWGDRFCNYLAQSAATGRYDILRIAALRPQFRPSFAPAVAERAHLGLLDVQQKQAGLGTAIGLERAFGEVRVRDLRRYEHHRTHAAFAAMTSGFTSGLCLVVDGMGEAGPVTGYSFAGPTLRELEPRLTAFSAGFFFGLLTDLAGFDQSAGEEWKLMGLAPYGNADPELDRLVHRLFEVRDGVPHNVRAAQVQSTVDELLARRPDDAVGTGWADLARVAQDTFVEIMDLLVAAVLSSAPTDHLVLTGGCALNSSYVGGLRSRHDLTTVRVPSAPGDDGNALGAALLAWTEDHGVLPPTSRSYTPYLGSSSDPSVLLRMRPHESRLRELPEDEVVEEAATRLADGHIIGWMQGRAEFGPRALGNRSVLADPRSPEVKDLINSKIKHREGFRPFAPSILMEHGPEWFEDFQDSPYMERTLRWKAHAHERVPGVVHVDGTGRLQTVTRQRNPLFHALLARFAELAGVPILLNTSLNVMGKPIVHSTEDALLLFYTTGLDTLFIGNWMLEK